MTKPELSPSRIKLTREEEAAVQHLSGQLNTLAVLNGEPEDSFNPLNMIPTRKNGGRRLEEIQRFSRSLDTQIAQLKVNKGITAE